MSKKLDLNDQNKATVMLVQALLGAISPNFRRISLAFTEPVWQLLFVLENECLADREEIEDVAGEFDALLLGLNAGSTNFDVKVVVSTEGLTVLDPSLWRVVFRRREI
jgi:hypothetical protein